MLTNRKRATQSAIIITGHKWKPSTKPNYCGKLDVFTEHDGRKSWYLLDVSGTMGPKRSHWVQSATCIPFGTRAGPRNVTNRLPLVVNDWVNAFLLQLDAGTAVAESAPLGSHS